MKISGTTNKGQILALHKYAKNYLFCSWSDDTIVQVGKMKVKFYIDPIGNKQVYVYN